MSDCSIVWRTLSVLDKAVLSDKQDYVNSDIYLQTVTIISNIFIFYIIITIYYHL